MSYSESFDNTDRGAMHMWAEGIAFAAGVSATSLAWGVKARRSKRLQARAEQHPFEEVMADEIRSAVRQVAAKYADPIGASLVSSSLLQRENSRSQVPPDRRAFRWPR